MHGSCQYENSTCPQCKEFFKKGEIEPEADSVSPRGRPKS